MLRDGFLRFCDDPEIACCRAERELGQLRQEAEQLRDQLLEAQRRERAAVEDIRKISECRDNRCDVCANADRTCVYRIRDECQSFEWHSPQARDFYPTPQSAISILLDNYQLRSGWILEPCAGDGAICKALRNRPDVWDGSLYAVEVRTEEKDTLREYCDDVLIKDFLHTSLDDFDYPMPAAPGTIITNPPFSIAEQVIERCFEIADERTEIIMFLKLAFMETKERHDFWKRHPNVSLISLMRRPSFTGKGTDFAAYGWFIWNKRKQFIMPCVAENEAPNE